MSYKIKTNPFNLLIITQRSKTYLNILYHITDTNQSKDIMIWMLSNRKKSFKNDFN